MKQWGCKSGPFVVASFSYTPVRRIWFSSSKHTVNINSCSGFLKLFHKSMSPHHWFLILFDVQVRFGKTLYWIPAFSGSRKCTSRRMLFWQQFYRFWPQCRSVSTVQWIMALILICLRFCCYAFSYTPASRIRFWPSKHTVNMNSWSGSLKLFHNSMSSPRFIHFLSFIHSYHHDFTG